MSGVVGLIMMAWAAITCIDEGIKAIRKRNEEYKGVKIDIKKIESYQK